MSILRNLELKPNTLLNIKYMPEKNKKNCHRVFKPFIKID